MDGRILTYMQTAQIEHRESPKKAKRASKRELY